VLHTVSGTPDGVRALAFQRGDDWTVVTWNEASATRRFTLALPAAARPTAAFATSATKQLTRVDPPARTHAGTWCVTLAPDTIVTTTFHGRGR
jgi:hypothetical protein